MEQNNKQTMPCFELGNLYVFKEEDEDGELTIIGKLIAKNESQRQRILSEILSAQQREIAGKFQAMATESPRKGEGVPAQILPEEKSSSEEREEDNAESRYR